MPGRHRVLALVLLASILANSCGSVEPTAPSLPVTATQIALATTNTPRPPSATPATPTATQMLIPPTATSTDAPVPAAATSGPPTESPKNMAPVISAIAEQIRFPGEPFPPVPLDDYVHDDDHATAELVWTTSGNVEFEVAIVDRMAIVTPPDKEWLGSETMRFEVCDPAGLCDATSVVFTVIEASEIEITYICNAGFLISCHGKKILVDALFRPATAGCSSVPYLAAMKDAQPPFDGVDLIVATHAHADHFDAQIVGTHLTNNPQAVFVSTRQSVDGLLGDFRGFDEIQDRVVGVDLQKGQSTQLTLKGIHLEFINIPHVNVRAGGMLNLGVFLQVGGLHLFHPGDAEPMVWQESYFQAYEIANRQIDIAFIPQRFFTEDEYHSIIVEGIGADKVIPMHFFGIGAQEAMDEIAAEFPEGILFREEMQSWAKVYPSDTPGAAPSPSPTPTAVSFQVTRDVPYLTAGHPKQKLDIYAGSRASTHSYPCEDRFVVVLENVRSGGRLPGVFDVGRNIAAILYGCSYDSPGSRD